MASSPSMRPPISSLRSQVVKVDPSVAGASFRAAPNATLGRTAPCRARRVPIFVASTFFLLERTAPRVGAAARRARGTGHAAAIGRCLSRTTIDRLGQEQLERCLLTAVWGAMTSFNSGD